MKRLGEITGYAFVVLVLLAGIWISARILMLMWGIGEKVVQGAGELEPNVYVPLTVTLATAVVGLSVTLFTQYFTRRKEIETAHRERRIEIYLEFLRAIESLLLAAKPELQQEAIDENSLVIQLVKIRTKAVLWSSPRVLKALSKFTKIDNDKPWEMWATIDELQRAMRRDIGLSNRGLGKMFFFKLNLNGEADLELKNFKPPRS